jgi:tRNA pseudouridine-54 N-methylase
MSSTRKALLTLLARGETRVLLLDDGVDIEQDSASKTEPDAIFIPANDLEAVAAALEDARKRLKGM